VDEVLADRVREPGFQLSAGELRATDDRLLEVVGTLLGQPEGAARDEELGEAVAGGRCHIDEGVAVRSPREEGARNVDGAGGVDLGDAFGRTHVRTDSGGMDDRAYVTSVGLRALKQLLDGCLVGDVAHHADRFDSGGGQLGHRIIEARLVEVGQHDPMVVTHQLRRGQPHPSGPAGDDRGGESRRHG
jgi:hypothetical protein